MRANLIAALIGVLCVVGCGSGGGSVGGGGTPPPDNNVLAVIVDSGPPAVANSNSPAVNTLYTSVIVCVPGTNTCQTIDHVQVDTGSSGLRLLGSVLTIDLPLQKDANGNTIAECTQFVDGSSWGALHLADIKLAGETAGNQAVQVIDTTAFAVPTECSGTTTGNTVVDFGANGILGVGPFLQDCGPACTVQGNGVYFTCPTNTTCSDSAMPLAQQLTNPVASFATDNNGVIIQLGSVNGTASSVSGSMIFGIGTQGNNGLGSAQVFTLNDSGELTTTYNGTQLTRSFIDSGSNAYYFPDNTITVCADTSHAPGFFCPLNGTLNLSASILGINGTGSLVNFSVANADSLIAGSTRIAAAGTLAHPSTSLATDNTTFDGTQTFDWGLPFYFGRGVYTAIESQNTAGGMGPYFAF